MTANPANPDNPHLGRWCVVNEEPDDHGGALIHHIYASFSNGLAAARGAEQMNRLITPVRGPWTGPNRTKVIVMHYYSVDLNGAQDE